MTLLADLAVSDGQAVAVAAFLCGIIGTLFMIREKERAAWFERVTLATKAMDELATIVRDLTRAMEERNRVVAALSTEVASLRSEVEQLRDALREARP